jgi:putative oxidoreductase
MTAWLNFVFLPLLARIFLVCLFPFSGLDKILHWDDALKQANSSFLPNGRELLIIGMAVEFLAPVCIIFNWHDRLAAFILAGFCAVTALLYHNFWSYADFWSPGDSQGRSHFWDFLKNFGLAGGLCLIIIGGSLSPLSSVLAAPLSSSPGIATP